MNPNDNRPGLNPPCRHLRNKEMYYSAPGDQEDEFASGAYWCAKSQETVGPDGQPADKTECCASRACYVAS